MARMNVGRAITDAMQDERDLDRVSMIHTVSIFGYHAMRGWTWGWYGPDVVIRNIHERGRDRQGIHDAQCKSIQRYMPANCNCSLFRHRPCP